MFINSAPAQRRRSAVILAPARSGLWLRNPQRAASGYLHAAVRGKLDKGEKLC